MQCPLLVFADTSQGSTNLDTSCALQSKKTGSHSVLPKMEWKMLQRQVHEDSEKIMDQFVELLHQTALYLKQTRCEVKPLLVCLMDLKVVRSTFEGSSLKELELATCGSEVLYILVKEQLVSFLHYKIIKRIIENSCFECENLKQKMKEYEKSFEQYISRRVCECSVYNDGKFEVFHGTDSQDIVELIIITDETWDMYTKFVKVLDLERIVAKVFRCNPSILKLESIEPQCLKLCYAALHSVVDSIFPLTVEEWQELRMQGITEIHCREFHYVKEEKGIAHVLYTCTGYNSIDDIPLHAATGVVSEFVKYDKMYQSNLYGMYF